MEKETTRALEYLKGSFAESRGEVLEEREKEGSWDRGREVRGKEREREFDGENKRESRATKRRERGMIMGFRWFRRWIRHNRNTPRNTPKQIKEQLTTLNNVFLFAPLLS